MIDTKTVEGIFRPLFMAAGERKKRTFCGGKNILGITSGVL